MLEQKIKENISFMYGDLKYIKTMKKKKDFMETYLEKSCKYGHLEIVKYLLKIYVERNYFVYDKLFRICCEYGHLRLAKYFLVKYPNISIEHSHGIFYSLKNNYIKTSKWLFYPYSREYIKKCVKICIEKKNINFIKWIIQKDNYFKYINDIFILCIDNKEIFNYILSLEEASSKEYKLQYAMDYFCRNGNFKEIKYLFSFWDKFDIYNCLMNSISLNKNNRIFDYILDNFTEKLNKDLLFKLVIINDNKSYVKKIIHKYKNDLNKNELFYYVCIYGYLNVLKEFYHDNIPNLDKCMQILLDNNHLKCIEWLVPLIEKKIDFNKLKFNYVRDIEIVLFLKGYNVHIEDELFEKALKFRYMDLITTLCELYPTRFKYDKSKRTGFIIKRSKKIKEKNCHICLCELKDDVLLNCGHLFCEGCINEWLKKHFTCPICRKNINNIILLT